MSTIRRFVLVEPEQWDEMRRKRKYHEDPHEKRLVDADRQLDVALSEQNTLPSVQRQDIANKIQQVESFRPHQERLVPLPPITPAMLQNTPSWLVTPRRETPASITAARKDYYGIMHPEYTYASSPESTPRSVDASTPRSNDDISAQSTPSTVVNVQRAPTVVPDDILSPLAPRVRARAEPILEKLLTMPQFSYDPDTSAIILNGQAIPDSNITRVLRRLQVTIPSVQKKPAGYNEIVELLSRETDLLPSAIARSPVVQKIISDTREKIPNKQLFADVPSLP